MTLITDYRITQCPTCPWRVGCNPDTDIPNGYSRALHEGLRGTIATGAWIPGAIMRVMACHYSSVGEERACAGWLYNQIGAGNNIAARIAVTRGHLPVPLVDGEQHECFDDTLPWCRDEAHHGGAPEAVQPSKA